MKRNLSVSHVFTFLGILLLCAGLLLSWLCAQASPLFLQPSEDARNLTETFMEALASGDLDSAGSMLLGQPQLTFAWSEASSLSIFLWVSYIDSIQFTFPDDLAPTDSGCCRPVSVTALDIPALMQQLKERAPELLAQEAALIGEDQAFGEDNHYRQDFVMNVLNRELETVVSDPEFTASLKITLELVQQNGRWWIRPSQELLDLLCGKIA